MQVLDANSGMPVILAPVDVRTMPRRSRITHWFAPLVAALYETRRIQAEREIARNWHLLGGLDVQTPLAHADEVVE